MGSILQPSHSGKNLTTAMELQSRQAKLCKAWPEGLGPPAKKNHPPTPPPKNPI